MKKLTVLALLATVIMASPLLAVQRHLGVVPNATFAAGSPASTNNNDSCDIGVAPAATLLLPYFQVDMTGGASAANTLFTITNTSRFPQFAHVTVWTAWSYPVLDFNLFLTGYDVQGVSMFDVIKRGQVPVTNPLVVNSATTSVTTPNATPNSTAVAGAPPAANLNLLTNSIGGTAATNVCNPLPGGLPPDLVTAVQNALTIGSYSLTPGSVGASCAAAGPNNGANTAIGYVTVDVAATCSTQLPNDPAYYTGGTATILFDNVLIGDYQQIGPTPAAVGGSFDAGGNPMVHIRAVPEGGLSGSSGGIPVTTNLPFTFYDRYTNPATPTARTADRRQPLPSTFAARYIEGGANSFATNFKIWREGVNNGTCSGAGINLPAANAGLLVTAVVRFDEAENSSALGANNQICSPCSSSPSLFLPETSSTPSTTAPPIPGFLTGSTATGGWVYFNLSNNGTGLVSSGNPGGTAAGATALTAQRVGFGSAGAGAGGRTTTQNWVIISMFGLGRLSVDFDAAWLANGCTAAPAAGSTAPIAPGAQRNPPGSSSLVCPPGGVCAAGTIPSAPTP